MNHPPAKSPCRRRKFPNGMHVRLFTCLCFITALIRQFIGSRRSIERYLNMTRLTSSSNPLSPAFLDNQAPSMGALSFPQPLNKTKETNRITKEKTPEGLQLAWLLSFPNSGTSYTLTLVERASNLSIATHHGKEVVTMEGISIPAFNDTKGGPYWEGLINTRGTERRLPERGYLLTKSHCGSRCANCGLRQYKMSLPAFTKECQKTTGRWKKRSEGLETVTSYVPLEKVAKVVWLMRHPLENIVARYHLERRNWERKAKKDSTAANILSHFHKNSTGFRNWCTYLDETFESDPSSESLLPADVSWSLWSRIPCRGEFYKYTQWHNYVGQMLQGEASVLQNRPKMHWYYEDYDNATNPRNENNLPVDEFLNYLHQTRVGPIKEFRTPMPIYRKTHFSNEERRLIWILIHSLATSLTWALLGRYYQDHRTEDQA